MLLYRGGSGLRMIPNDFSFCLAQERNVFFMTFDKRERPIRSAGGRWEFG
jgi:hypothetical protein